MVSRRNPKNCIMSDRKRLLNDLRVVDLRAELERRNLDKSGVRGVLIQRLSKYIEDEGHDPATYMLDISDTEVKSTPTKRIRSLESTAETPTMVDMIVQGDVGDAAEPAPAAAKPAPVDVKMDVDDAKPCLDDNLRDIKDGTEATQSIKLCLDNDLCDIEDSTEASQLKDARLDNHLRDIKDDTEATQPIKPCRDIDSKNGDHKGDNHLRDIKDDTEATKPVKPCVNNDLKDDDHKGDNTMDTEDSINLHLCEDELLNEETENTMKPEKDDGAGEDIAESTGNENAVKDAVANDAMAQDAARATDSTTSNDQQVIAEAPATSNDDGDEDNKDDNKDGEKRTDDTKEGGARNLWVSGLSGATRAKDLKQLCSKYGKVIGAKVVTNARTPGSRCYGFVTLASTQDVENCIKNLHKTKLHGRMMFVEKARSEAESASRRPPSRPERRASRDGSKENEDGKDGDKKDSKPEMDGEVSTHRSASHSRGKSHRSDKSKGEGSTRSRERRNWKEQNLERARELKRARDQLRMQRVLERERRQRRIAADMEMHERARRQREEKHRLALELEQLRAERIKIEREKTELLRLERERHRLERERLELERLELKRAQLRLEVERRGRGYESSAPPYRKPGARSPPTPAYERDRHKRPAAPPMSSSRAQLVAPPPPRFEAGAYDRGAGKGERDYPRHVSSGNIKYLTNGSTNDDSRQALPPGSRTKEPIRSYESRDSRAYRQAPAPPAQPEPRGWGASSRYTTAAASAPAKGSGSEAWGGAAPRYAAGYETRYAPTPAYQPPPPGAAASYPDRYYRKY